MADDYRKKGGRRAGGDFEPWTPGRPMGLARALLKAGYATRRQADRMVAEGRVAVDGDVVTEPGRTVDPGAVISLDGRPLERLQMRYFALHKPTRVVCDEADGAARKLVREFFPSDVPGLAAAGRLDSKTTGLILFSNDTVWNTMITTTRGLEEEYRVQVEGELSDIELNVLGAGVHLPGLGMFRPHLVRVVERMQGRTVVNVTMREGKVRQLRRMLETLRHKVNLVRRVRIGDVRLGDLGVGAVRELNGQEIQSIREIRAAIARRETRHGGRDDD